MAFKLRIAISFLVLALVAAWAVDAKPAPAKFTVKELPLPGAKGLVTLDYFAYDPAHQRIWVPAGNLGTVDVIDARSDQITPISGFHTGEYDVRGRKRVLGPSSATIGEGVVYVGNRADSSICPINVASLKVADCLRIATPAEGLAGAPDGVVYVGITKEVWVTRAAPPLGIGAPDRALTIFDAADPSHLKPKGKIALSGSAEGYAVDSKRSRFYTNVEEDGRTVAIDLRSRQIISTWHSGCDEPRGLALDQSRGFLFVACSARVIALDLNHDGRVLGSLETGDGLDNIGYSEAEHRLYAAASVAAKLTIASVDAHGKIEVVGTVPTAEGMRGVVATSPGHAYMIDPRGGKIWKVTAQ
jgi:DNA-binding beta-propeller fold protein YncE